ncbi:MAG: T9SS type A sorting domain-containing protein [Bacteroidota bacterium]
MSKQLLILSLFLNLIVVNAQTVSTVTNGNFHDGLAVDSQGNVYGSDFPPVAPWPNPIKNVYKYDTDGNLTVFASGFLSPNGIGINSQNEIYICDHYGNLIKKYSDDGTLLQTFDGGLFATPAGIKPIPNSLDMLVVEYDATSGNKIKKLNQDGSVDLLYSGAPLNGPAGIAFIGETAYVANFNDRKIFSLINNNLIEIAQLPSNSNPNSDFLGFLTSANGQLYATHIGLGQLFTVDPDNGSVAVYAGSVPGSDDGAIATATFSSPNGITYDALHDKMYVSETVSKNLRVISNATLSTQQARVDLMKISVVPNPVSENLNIEIGLKTLDTVHIEIIDLSGKIVHTENVIPENVSFSIDIPVTNLSKGHLLLRCEQNGLSISKKIILK